MNNFLFGLKVPIESETTENFSEEGRLISIENKTRGEEKISPYLKNAPPNTFSN